MATASTSALPAGAFGDQTFVPQLLQSRYGSGSLALVRIFHVIESLGPGGAERQLVNVVRATGTSGHSHFVVQLGGDNHFAGELLAAGARVWNLRPEGRSGGALRTSARLAEFVSRERPDVLHSWMFTADVAARLVTLGRFRPPLVTSVQAPQYEPAAARFAGWPRGSVALRQLVDAGTACLRPSAFVACSHYVAASCMRRLHVPARRIRVIYNAIDLEALGGRGEEARASTRRSLGLSDDALVFVHVGRLDAQKGHRDLIDAFAEVTRRVPHAYLLLIGTGPLESWIRAWTRERYVSDRVHMLGARRDVVALLRAADVFVLPSLFEGLPLALLEAMGLGLPAIASAISPLAEVIEHGRSGILVPPSRPDSLAAAMVALSTDAKLLNRLGTAGQERVARQFSMAATKAEWIALYDELAGPTLRS